MRYFLFLILSLFLAPACQPEEGNPLDETPYSLELPAGFPYPEIPEDNELTVARVALGKRLFYDPILSADSTISCASCHKQSLAFADDVPISPGVQGRLGLRNAPTLANVAYLGRLNKDGGVVKLDLQPVVPIEDHNEMNLPLPEAERRLNAHPDYRDDFMRAYGKEASAFTLTRALGAFMRTLISGDSRYDRYNNGAETALNAAEQEGMSLFFSERLGCGHCHQGFNLTDNSFRNNGLYTIYEDPGRSRVTLKTEDEGKFRVPTLRNIALTAPYMHDGSLPSLEAVIEHYNSGGSAHPNKDTLIHPLQLSETEKANLAAFLRTLTDNAFIANPAFRKE
ncbi:MAG: cytochrome-c peroxidase [Lewinellaceae bacterium]|nr:cytochrome-c peroxidase [Phaeodactylibacter sp.]MCB9039510.1 cytochrome-c peroxidase [Lewinellaceae bacterium]